MKIKSWIILISGIALPVLAIFIFRPVEIREEKDCITVRGTVLEVYEGGVKDAVFKLSGYNELFYVNRGFERGLDLKTLRSDLQHKEIVIKYQAHWTPLDPLNYARHVSKIQCEGRTIFNELN